jgi:hypothetical protein
MEKPGDWVHTHEVYAFGSDRPKQRWVCDGCNRWTAMDVWVDSRTLEKTKLDDGRVMLTEKGLAPDADPPRRLTLYVCPECNHAHEGQPSLKNPT